MAFDDKKFDQDRMAITYKDLGHLAKIEENHDKYLKKLIEENPALADEISSSGRNFKEILRKIRADSEERKLSTPEERLKERLIIAVSLWWLREIYKNDSKYVEDMNHFEEESKLHADYYFNGNSQEIYDFLKEDILSSCIILLAENHEKISEGIDAELRDVSEQDAVGIELQEIYGPTMEDLHEKDQQKYQDIMRFIQKICGDNVEYAKLKRIALEEKKMSKKEIRQREQELFENFFEPKQAKRFVLEVTKAGERIFSSAKSSARRRKTLPTGIQGNLNPYDHEIYNTVITLWVAGNEYITPQMIFDTLSGNRTTNAKINYKQRSTILKSLKKMRNYQITLTATSRAQKNEGSEFEYQGSLLPYHSSPKILCGQKKDDYGYTIHLEMEPPLYTYAKGEDEFGSVDIRMLDIVNAASISSITHQNIIVRGYLLREMVRANPYDYENIELEINYKKLYKNLVFQGLNVHYRDVISKVESYLEFWDKRGQFIKITKKDSIESGISIVFDSEFISRTSK